MYCTPIHLPPASFTYGSTRIQHICQTCVCVCTRHHKLLHLHPNLLSWQKVLGVQTNHVTLGSVFMFEPAVCSQLPLSLPLNSPPSAIVARRQQRWQRWHRARTPYVLRCSPCTPFHTPPHSHSNALRRAFEQDTDTTKERAPTAAHNDTGL